MKSIIALSIIFFSLAANEVKNDYISVEYIGDADIVMPVIYMSKKSLPRSDQVITVGYNGWAKNYIVSTKEFNLLKDIIHSTERKLFVEKDYNGFKITTREHGSVHSYFITRKVSSSFFLKSIDNLKNNKSNNDLIWNLNVLRTKNVF